MSSGFSSYLSDILAVANILSEISCVHIFIQYSYMTPDDELSITFYQCVKLFTKDSDYYNI